MYYGKPSLTVVAEWKHGDKFVVSACALSMCMLCFNTKHVVYKDWSQYIAYRDQCQLNVRQTLLLIPVMPEVMRILRLDYPFANCEMYLRMFRTTFQLT